MRKLIAGVFVTLDGVVQDPGGFGELEHGGWSLDYFDDASREQASQQLLASSRFLLGRTTYEIIERAWSRNSRSPTRCSTRRRSSPSGTACGSC